jgi:hypothetical protein
MAALSAPASWRLDFIHSANWTKLHLLGPDDAFIRVNNGSEGRVLPPTFTFLIHYQATSVIDRDH